MKPCVIDPLTCNGFGVYVIEANDGRIDKRMTKIGMTGGMQKRMVSLATSCPHPLTLRHWQPCEDKSEARWIERMAHDHWSVKRFRSSGEWFDMPRGAIASIGIFIEAMTETYNGSWPFPQGMELRVIEATP